MTFLLLDKGYFDYDYKRVDIEDEIKWEDTVRSPEELQGILAGFGIGTAAPKKEMTQEEIQEHIIKQMED